MMKKIFSVLLALALVLSFSAVATPVSADQWAELVANITAPASGVDKMGGDEFVVSANVTNNASLFAKDVKATIAISGNATLKAGEVETKNVITELGENWSRAVNWTLVCTGAGVVNITVKPSGKDPFTLNDIVPSRLHSDTVSINQKKVLEVTIVAPADFTAFNVTQGFNVTAKVKNISSLNATDVQLTISIDRYAQLKAGEYATRTVGELVSNATSAEYTWAVNCTGNGFSRITVSPSGKVGGVAIPAAALTARTITVKQEPFVEANITLVEGWNLISLPLIPLDSAINAVLAGVLNDVKSVWYWSGRWYSFVPGGPSDLTLMRDGKAYWINMGANQTLHLAGREMPEGAQLPPTYDVVVGWNMVGFKSIPWNANNVTAKDYLEGTKYVRIYFFESGTWFLIAGPDYNNPKMKPGLGYWVAFTEPGTIYPP
jgi:nitrogen fixation protein